MLRGASSPAQPTRSVVVAAAALLVALTGAGCSDDGADEAVSTTSSSTTVTTETVPPTDPDTVTTASTPPAEPTRPTAFTAEARDAVNELKAAWDEGDQDRARAIAPGEVVDALFPISPQGFEVYGCDTGEFETSTCSFRNRSTGTYITVTSTRTEPGWQVSSLFVDGA